MGTSAGATYQFQLLPVKAGGQEKRWVKTKPFQHHTHDVRAVVHTPTALISGGEGCVGKLHGCSPFPPSPPFLPSPLCPPSNSCLYELHLVSRPGCPAGDPPAHGEGTEEGLRHSAEEIHPSPCECGSKQGLVVAPGAMR